MDDSADYMGFDLDAIGVQYREKLVTRAEFEWLKGEFEALVVVVAGLRKRLEDDGK